MTAWADLQRFAPLQLQKKLAEVEAVHKVLVESGDLAPGLLEALRRKLEQTPSSDIPALAGTLSKRELVAIADLLVSRPGEEIESKAVSLGTTVKSGGLVARSWKLIIDGGSQSALEKIIASGLGKGLSGSITFDDLATNRVAAWFGSAGLMRNLLGDLERSTTKLGAWFAQLPSLTTEITSDSELGKALQMAILTDGSKILLMRHKSDLLPWMRDELSRSRSALPEHFSANYLLRMRDDKTWDADVIDWITGKLGVPKPEALVDSWRRIDRRSPGVVRELASWLALRQLEKFFRDIRDPHGRFKFWRDNFANDFAHVEPLAHREAMLLHIPPIAVVEFAHKGNAAYVYSQQHLDWLSAGGFHDVDYYKRRSALVKRPSDRSEFRIIHQKGWQRRYLSDLRNLVVRGRR